MGLLAKAIGTGVGFVAEAASRNKNKAAQDEASQNSSLDRNSSQDKPPPYQSSSESDVDPDSDSQDEELQWALDEEAEQNNPAMKRDFQGQVAMESLVSAVVSKGKSPQANPSSLPVILAQKRPGSHSRGFVRGYAQSLNTYGIDEGTFLTFLDNMVIALKSSPALNVIMVGANIAGFIPDPTAQAVTTVVQFVVGTAIELQRRYRGNSYIDQINDQLFKPRGLFAVVMSYVPNAPRPITAKTLDINAMVDGKNPSSLGWLKLAKANSYGDLELPESEPLIFPGVSKEAEQKLLEENAMQKSARWTTDYMDRRSQAQWVHDNPGSRLQPTEDGQKPTFQSSMGDPTHPMYGGSLTTLLSGGRLGQRKTARIRARREARFQRREQNPILRYAPIHNLKKAVRHKKKLKKNMFYLMVVPIPSQAQLDKVEKQLEGAVDLDLDIDMNTEQRR